MLHNGGETQQHGDCSGTGGCAQPCTFNICGGSHSVCVCVGGGESLRSSTATETTENTGFLFFATLKHVLMSSFVSPVEMLP